MIGTQDGGTPKAVQSNAFFPKSAALMKFPKSLKNFIIIEALAKVCFPSLDGRGLRGG